MKLRNKKTGGLANILGDEQDFIRVYTDAGWHDYDSVAEMMEEWEDYHSMEKVYENVKVVFDVESSYLYIYDKGKQVGFFYVNEED